MVIVAPERDVEVMAVSVKGGGGGGGGGVSNFLL